MSRSPNRSYAPKNKVLWRAIRRKGYKTVSDLCQTEIGYNLHQTEIGRLLQCKASPLKKDGSFRTCCLALQEILDVTAEELFSLKLYEEVLPSTITLAKEGSGFPKAVGKKLERLCDVKSENPATGAAHELLRARIREVLKTLSYRQREIVKLRYGLGDGYVYTLEEVGHIFRATRERVKRVEAKAVRKLQQPNCPRELAGFLD